MKTWLWCDVPAGDIVAKGEREAEKTEYVGHLANKDPVA